MERRGPPRAKVAKPRLLLALVTAFTLIVTACAGAPQGPSQGGAATPGREYAPAGTTTLTLIPYQGAADCWNPYKCNTGKMFVNVYSTLLYRDADFKLHGYLAESWTATPSAMTFTIKKGVTCSDGTPLTAADVGASLEWYFDSASTTKLTNFGAGPYRVSVDGPANKVTITLGTPHTDAIYGVDDFFGGHQTSIICKAGIAALKANPLALDTPTTTYGTGPYVVSEAIPGGAVTLKLRPEFAWGPNGITAKTPGMPGTIVYQIVTNPTTAANLILAGTVNMASITGPDAQRLASNKSLEYRGIAAHTVNGLWFNFQGTGPTTDPKVRQALATAIDPKLYIQALGQNGTLSSSFVTPNVPCFDATTARRQPTPSVAEATKILQGAGWTLTGGKLSKDGKPLTLRFPVRSGYGSANEYMATAWQQMGATVEFQQLDNATWQARRTSLQYDVTILNNVLDYPTVGISAPTMVSTTPPRPRGTNVNPAPNWQELQGLVDQAEGQTGEAQCATYQKLQQRAWDDWLFYPVYAPVSDWFGNGVDISQHVNQNFSVFGIKMLASKK